MNTNTIRRRKRETRVALAWAEAYAERRTKLERLLRNWAAYCCLGPGAGPRIKRACGSAEGAYDAPAGNIWETSEPAAAPVDVDLGETIEALWRELARHEKGALITHYVRLRHAPLHWSEEQLITHGARLAKYSYAAHKRALSGARGTLLAQLEARRLI